VQYASELLVAVKSGVLQGLIKTGDRSLVHFLVQSVAAVNPHDGRLITEAVRVRRWPTECLRPVCRQAFGVVGVVSVAERMANHFVLEHSRVPRVGQPLEPVETARGFKDRLVGFSVHSRIMQDFKKRERCLTVSKSKPADATVGR